MEGVPDFLTALLFPESLGGIIVRGLIWSVIAVVIVISSNRYAPGMDTTGVIKRRVGSLLLFVGLSIGLVYLLFSYIPA